MRSLADLSRPDRNDYWTVLIYHMKDREYNATTATEEVNYSVKKKWKGLDNKLACR
jgi:hypothetical protein